MKHEDIRYIAREYLGLGGVEVHNICSQFSNVETASYELLERWREKSGDNLEELYQHFVNAKEDGIAIDEAILDLISSSATGMYNQQILLVLKYSLAYLVSVCTHIMYK